MGAVRRRLKGRTRHGRGGRHVGRVGVQLDERETCRRPSSKAAGTLGGEDGDWKRNTRESVSKFFGSMDISTDLLPSSLLTTSRRTSR